MENSVQFNNTLDCLLFQQSLHAPSPLDAVVACVCVHRAAAGGIEPNTVKKYSGEKPYAKEIDTHNSNGESAVFHYAATPLHL